MCMCELVAEKLVALECIALKTCSKCGIEKPTTEFYKGKKDSPLGQFDDSVILLTNAIGYLRKYM